MSAKQSPAPFKRSIDGLFNVWLNLKNQGHLNEKPLRNAMYNVAILTVIFLIIGVCLVLGPFFKPLLWSFLFGALLFPFKLKLATALNNWLNRVEFEDKHLLIGIIRAPIEGCNELGEVLTNWLRAHLKLIVIVISSLVSLRLILWFAPQEMLYGVWNFIVFSHSVSSNVLSSLNMHVVLVIVITYAISVHILWKPEISNRFTIIGQILWIVIIGYGCSFLGALQVPVFLSLMLYGSLGIVYNLQHDEKNTNFIDKCRNLLDVKKYMDDSFASGYSTTTTTPSCSKDIHETALTEDERLNKINEIKTKMKLNVPETPTTINQQQSNLSAKHDNESLESDLYFRILFYACGITLVWKHTWILFLGLFPVILYVCKQFAYSLGILTYFDSKYQEYSIIIRNWILPRHSALLPLCFPGILHINENIHKYVCAKLKSYVDDISALIMITLLIVFVILISIFSFTQIYSETIAVAQLGSSLINRTLTHRPELVEMLPIDMKSMDDIIDNAYKYGRTHIEDYVDGIFNDTDPAQAKKLKCQILSVWDRVIQSWMDRNNDEKTVGPRVTRESIKSTIDEIVINPITKAGIIGWIKTNFGMLIEVADSLWMLLRTNLSLLLSAFGTLFSVVLGGGHAVIKFLFHTIIFFTTLFYLLQSSQDRYAPIAVNINSSWGSRLASSLEDSISSVLVATLKLATFHGLFTWLTHTVFGAHIVYLPAVLASILAAAPFLETYWCSVPAFLDLWLSQDRFWLGILLVLIHFIVPSNFNPIIHSEIKGGGHPYLTGLSIAGGMYLLGLEGAVLGPLLLCLLVVLFDVTMRAIRDSPTTPHHTRKSSLDANPNDIFSPPVTT
uniref:Putative conserved plasma membrane protein n=1 Tax=Corethrella appendiculata TaxID=1370023 RepID=U5EIK1_9DIPT